MAVVFAVAAGTLPRSAARAAAEDAGAQASSSSSLVIETHSGPVHFDVEVAVTPQQRMRGLQGRAHLAADAGMLFTFDPPERAGMWMKDTYIPLDILFIAPSGAIVGIVENAEPMSLRPMRAPEPVRAVLELNAGMVERHGLRLGDRVTHKSLARSPSR